MKRQNILILFGLIAAAVPFLDAQENARRPNIIILLADDLGYADVSFNGGEIPTPAIDRLANEGVKLGSFYVSTVCSPTRAGLMTGRYPLRFGCMRSVIPPWRKGGMPPKEQTIAELCKQAGYTRRAIIGKWHLGHSERKYLPENQGFTHFYGHYNGAIDYFTHEREDETDWHRNRETVKEEGYSTDLLGAEAVRFIKESAKEPFLLYLPFNAPHSPFQALETDQAKFPQMEGNRKTYAAMIAAMDRAVKAVLDTLDELHLSDNTFVLFSSDNGGTGPGSNAPWRDGKFSLYDGGIRAAAAVRWPAGGIKGGGVIDGPPIGYIDVYPTLKSLLRLQDRPDPNPLDGINVLDVLRGKAAVPTRDWFSYIHQSGPDEKLAVISGGYKLMVEAGDILENKISSMELYDRTNDPAEQNNLAAAHPERCAELLAKLKQFRQTQRDPLPQYGTDKKGFTAPKDWIIK